MNPTQALANRTARLAREAATPVYTTSTPVPEHLYVAEMEHETYGNRTWSKPMRDADLSEWAEGMLAIGYVWSDHDHAAKCWCQFSNPVGRIG